MTNLANVDVFFDSAPLSGSGRGSVREMLFGTFVVVIVVRVLRVLRSLWYYGSGSRCADTRIFYCGVRPIETI